jgi:hypothetical protein
MQNVSNTPDLTVTGYPVTTRSLTATESMIVANGPSGSDVQVETCDSSTVNGELIIHVNRVLQRGAAPCVQAGRPCLSGIWRLPDGSTVRGVLATAEYRVS